MFGSTLYFFFQTIRATIQGSQETPGPVGILARSCGDRCGKKRSAEEEEEEEGGVSLDGGSSRSQTDSRLSRTVVVPITTRQQLGGGDKKAGAGTGGTRLTTQISLQQVRTIVTKDKVNKVQQSHAESQKAAIDRILQKKKNADARVRQRLVERKKLKAESGGKTSGKTSGRPAET